MKPLHLTAADRIAIERELCKRSLAEFAKRAWHILEPATPLKWGWALDAICAHLEAVSRGEITRLLMNVPPGTMKSLLTGVIWPAWEWGPRGLPEKRFLATAHKQDLAIRDNIRCRRLIQSEWYQARWPVPLVHDQNQKTKFENLATGFREAMAFTSMTGARGDRVILDDPLSADDANSEAALLAAELSFLEALPTRINNDRSAIVVIMQRLHERDTSGLILTKGLPYTHLCLPMRFEPDRRCQTSIGFMDPRRKDGELLFPERFPEDQVAELEKTLGSYATAGQLQQRPVPRGGGLFKKSWFGTVKALPVGCRFVRGWDLAATEDAEAAATAGCLMALAPDGRFIVADMVRVQEGPMGVERTLRATAEQDRAAHGAVRGSIPQDPGQAGKAQAQHMLRHVLVGHDYHTSTETGDKETRALPLAAQAEAGNVFLLEGAWNDAFLDELAGFPMGKWKDQVDAASRAFTELTTALQPRRFALDFM
ncbi:phage terminase large subunit [Paracoccus sp. DMF]|uniref:phage terminase large subunit n=1 Tax=Paracoccus sp. DMF TaxID=400837 RepID=UPI0010FFFDC4|nr:phage terminase large subunit [Paracoccus sp. DMF]MCV2448471.1 phage terminase large subunit [Paracoccus sp. DMF]